MEPGTAMEMLMPRDDTKSPSLSIHPASVDQAKYATKHPIGVKRITSICLIAPKDYQPIEGLEYVEKEGVLKLDSGEAWAVEVTFDKGAKRKQKDFRPELPLLIRY